MLAPDDKNSVLSEVSGAGRKSRAYSAYGYSADDATTDSGLGYNGELRDLTTGHYILGKGYRVFSPQMMRFYSPDSWSPFGEGGVNAYGYVAGNPVMHSDPTGHFKQLAILLLGTLMQAPDPSTVGRAARNLSQIDDPLAGWTMHTTTGSTRLSAGTPSPRATTSVNVSQNIASRSVDVGNVPKAGKKVGFDPQTEIFEYKQRMGPEHWTTKADERRAVAEVMSEEQATTRAAGPSNSNRPSTNPERTVRVQERIRQDNPKKLTVRQQAMLRRAQ
ncbi:RHS repeat-associated core domain-containing protein [Pseudomonas sp. NFX98]|uniref:RHS repeat-associated core domain-containing protein n=1 Tax=Pseudomonas sp. NFX98 TaxID=3399122 RepID=UPI0039FCFE73